MATEIQNVPTAERPGIVAVMAAQFQMEPKRFEQTLRATVMPSQTTPEQFAAFLLVAKRYGLNPLVKEIYAFPAKGGGIQPIVSIDGWLRIINDHPQMDGSEQEEIRDESGAVVAVKTTIWRKDRKHATVKTEYMAECKMGTDTWKKWPIRMLGHKSMIQAGRYAFGFSGIIDPDEAERMASVTDAPAEAPVEKSATAALRNRLAPPAQTIAPEDVPDAGAVDAPPSDVPEGDPSQPTGKE
jgi:phage recombination protein Bet